MATQISVSKIKEVIRRKYRGTPEVGKMPELMYIEIRKMLTRSCMESLIDYDEWQELNWLLGATVQEFNRRSPEQKLLVALVVAELSVKHFGGIVIDVHVHCEHNDD